MADTPDPKPRSNWLWLLVLAALALLLLFWFFNPAGDAEDTQVEDPIVTPEFGETTEDVGLTGEGLPEEGAEPALADEPVTATEDEAAPAQ